MFLKTLNMNFTTWKKFENFGHDCFFTCAKNLVFHSPFLQLQHCDMAITKWKCIPINN
jgi:hypothetical protein